MPAGQEDRGRDALRLKEQEDRELLSGGQCARGHGDAGRAFAVVTALDEGFVKRQGHRLRLNLQPLELALQLPAGDHAGVRLRS